MVEGYKQTDAGIIPDDWNDKTLGIITTSVSSGKSKTQSSIGGKFSIYGSTGIIGYSSRPDYEGERILVARVGANAGTVNRVKGDYCVSDNTLMVHLKEDMDINHIFYFLKFSNLNKLIFGSGQPLITGTQLRELPIPLPPTRAEQTAIATALNDADALMQKLEQLLAKKRNIKTGAMQDLLRTKEGWEKNVLGEVATLKARIGWQGLTTAEYRKTGNFFLITGTEFKNGFIEWDSCFNVDEERYKQDKNIQVRMNDVLVTKDGTIGKIALIKSVPKPATLNSGIFVIRPLANSFHPEFFYYLLLSDVFSIFLSQLSAGSTINHLYQKDFVTFEFYLPKSIEEQKVISSILFDIDNEIQKLEKKIEKYKMLKQGMMQNLLTGKIRLI